MATADDRQNDRQNAPGPAGGDAVSDAEYEFVTIFRGSQSEALTALAFAVTWIVVLQLLGGGH